MTTEKLLEELKRQLSEVQSAVRMVELIINGHSHEISHTKKKRAILKSIKRNNAPTGKGAYNGKHWMQQPKNKSRMLKMVAKMNRGR